MKVKICKTLLSQSRGLMFSKRRNLLFIFKTPRYVGLHMLFVFFPVDALYIDENGKIVEIKRMKPFRPYYKSKNKVKYVLELAEKHNFNVGDKLKFKDNEVDKMN